MPIRKYSSRSQQTTLVSAITSASTNMTVISGTSLLGGVTIPAGTTFTCVIDPDTAVEEIVDATEVSVNNFLINRGIDGSSAQAHSAGAVVRHMAIGRDYREANAHIEASNLVHGVSGFVVGTTDTQTISNKTLGSALNAGGFKVTNLATPTDASDAVRKDFADAQVAAAATSAASAATSASSAATSVTAAATSATSAAASATAAATSASSAAASATAAATSAASASTSASSALTSRTAATTSATSAAASATAAATSATSAAASATAAATSATSAAASATTAANSVATIATSATSAANSATAAATSATSAAASAALLTDSSTQISFQVFG
jgi:trimeric autotransporter adhesin